MKTADAFFIFTNHCDCLTGNFTCSHTFHILHNFFSHFFSTFIYVKSECFSYNFFSQTGRHGKPCRPLLIYYISETRHWQISFSADMHWLFPFRKELQRSALRRIGFALSLYLPVQRWFPQQTALTIFLSFYFFSSFSFSSTKITSFPT